MPSLFTVCGYRIYFWSNENDEPIHVHISKGKPSANATKIWLTKEGKCVIASNGSKIQNRELNELLEIISAQFTMICDAWKEHFIVNEIKFYM